MKRTIMTLSLLASLGLGATAQSGTIPQDVGVAQEQSEIGGKHTGSIQNIKASPMSTSSTGASDFTTVAGKRTYVVMYGGSGHGSLQYMARYNTMRFFYNTMVQRIGVPKDHIYCFLGSGTGFDWVDSSVPGMALLPAEIVPLDFDGDSRDDINGAANSENLKASINTITKDVNSGDHIVVLFCDNVTHPSIIGPYDGEGRISAADLSNWIAPLSDKGAGLSFVFSQSEAADYVGALAKDGITIVSLLNNEQTNHEYGIREGAMIRIYDCNWPHYNEYEGYFEEFACNWISAFNGYTPDGKTVNADYNGDGIVAMSEAFRWANANYLEFHNGKEMPQYVSTPNHVGHIQALAQPMYPDDLYLYTESGDTGLFYPPHASHFWASPDIWVRNSDDTEEKCIIPIYTEWDNGEEDYVFVKTRVHNRGWRPYTGGLTLQTFWREESLEVKPSEWLRSVDGEGNLTSDQIGYVPINDYIAPLGSTVVTTRWYLPNRKYSGVNILAAIRGHDDGVTSLDAIYHKGVARKSYSKITNSRFNITGSQSKNIKLYNNTTQVRRQGLKVKSYCGTESTLGIGTLDLVVPNNIYSYWVNNDVRLTDITISFKAKYENMVILSFNSPSSTITNIPIPPQTTLDLGVTMNAGRYLLGVPNNARVDLILLSSDGRVIGGMEYELEEFKEINPILSPGHGILMSELAPDEIMLTAQPVDGMEVVEWQDSNDNFIGDGETVIVTPAPGHNTFTLISRNEKEEYYEEKVEVPLYSSIDRIYNNSGKVYNVTFTRPAIEGTTIEAHGTMTGVVLQLPEVAVGEMSVDLDLSGLPNDTYVVAMKVKGAVTDTVRIISQ